MVRSTLPPTPDAQPVVVMQAADTWKKAAEGLGKVAEQFYGSGAKWEKVYEANRDTLKNPNYIFVGQKLSIPADG